MDFIVPKKWSMFQHYKNRNPPWIKLHRALLDDVDFQCLPVASKALAPMLWLVVSELGNPEDGRIEFSPRKLSFRLRMTEHEFNVGIKPLIDKGFFCVLSDCNHDASTMLADCWQVAIPEGEGETEKEKERDTSYLSSSDDDGKVGLQCPYEEIRQLYAEILGTWLPIPRNIDGARKKNLKARWIELSKDDEYGYLTKEEGLQTWKKLFGYISDIDHLCARGKSEWPGATIDWMLKAGNFKKILEGNYDKR